MSATCSSWCRRRFETQATQSERQACPHQKAMCLRTRRFLALKAPLTRPSWFWTPKNEFRTPRKVHWAPKMDFDTRERDNMARFSGGCAWWNLNWAHKTPFCSLRTHFGACFSREASFPLTSKATQAHLHSKERSTQQRARGWARPREKASSVGAERSAGEVLTASSPPLPQSRCGRRAHMGLGQALRASTFTTFGEPVGWFPEWATARAYRAAPRVMVVSADRTVSEARCRGSFRSDARAP